MSATAEKQLPQPLRFDRSTALGWNDVALDGLSCYLRCVEAVLRWRGSSREAVAVALGGPVDLLRRGRSGSTYDAHVVEWRVAEDGREHSAQLVETLRGGDPAILMPDRFFWPGDELEGRRHFHDHMVLAFEFEEGVLSVLDTDAPREREHVRRLRADADLWRACTRWGVVHPTAGAAPGSAGELAARVLGPSRELIGADLAELRLFAEQWRQEGLEEPFAHALHVAALGDFQPTLFLFAEAARCLEGGEELEAVTGPAFAAAKRAKSLGLLLLALHRETSPDAYAIAIGALDRFLDAVEVLEAAIAARLGLQPLVAEPTGFVRRRLSELASYCFAAESDAEAGSAAGESPLASSTDRVSS